jgi:hypothetical protein
MSAFDLKRRSNGIQRRWIPMWCQDTDEMGTARLLAQNSINQPMRTTLLGRFSKSDHLVIYVQEDA